MALAAVEAGGMISNSGLIITLFCVPILKYVLPEQAFLNLAFCLQKLPIFFYIVLGQKKRVVVLLTRPTHHTFLKIANPIIFSLYILPLEL